MKYLVAWNYKCDPVTWSGGCRYYTDRLEAYNDYKLFKGNTNLHSVHFIEIKEGVEVSIWIDKNGTLKFSSISELNEEWEDYKPAEPLIKDEKIRKAIQAWADANDDDSTAILKYDEKNVRLSTITNQIEFDRCSSFDRLEDGATYTIAKLCGEEEE